MYASYLCPVIILKQHMKHLFSLIVFLFTISTLAASDIKGIVRDADTKEDIIGAIITIKELSNSGAVTGLDGSFSFSNISLSSVTLICKSIGYQTQEVIVESKSTTELIILLKPVVHEMSEIVVLGAALNNTDNAVRGLEKNAMTVMNIVSAKAIEISPDLTVANVAQRISGVTIERNSSGDGQYAILRGMDKRYNYTLVNGIKIPSPDNKNRFVPLDIFPAELLDRLEVTKSLTSDMEGDGIGGAINLVMKDAPSIRQITANLSTGYNTLFFDRDFLHFDTKAVDNKSPYELYGEKYAAKPRDFSKGTIDLKSGKAEPNLLAGFSYGDRLFKDKFGIMLAGSYQNSYRGSNSLYFNSATATSDASNLPVLTGMNNRTYSEQQKRIGLHAKLDYKFSENHQLQWYNAYMIFNNAQVRDMKTTDFSIGYNPSAGDYNLSFNTRFRYTEQDIFTSSLKGLHNFGRLNLDWSGVYSKANNKSPDNSTIHTVTTVRANVENPISVTTLGGAERRWEHNSDEDKAGYLNLRYNDINLSDANINLSIGGLYRNKQRSNFFNQYDFRPFDESKPEGSQNNLIKGVDWNTYPEIQFMVFTPYGALGNPLNYDASEEITAGYGQAKITFRKVQLTTGLRVEHTNQGYDLKYAIDGVENNGEQVYTDYLPSFHLKYLLTEKSNLRASYFKSLNRPSFFEIVPYRIINEDYTEAGNPDLKHTIAHNIDFRYEYFPKQSEQLMVGLFYKKIENPIELGMVKQGQAVFYMPTNYGNAKNYGVEIDFIKYFYYFGIKANYTFTSSSITTTKIANYDNPDSNASEKILVKDVDQKRPLNGQAKHVANISFLYKNQEKGWDGQLAFSYTGDRLYAISRYLDNDIWQAGYIQMDASVEKRFKMGISVFAKAANIFNTPMIQYLKKSNVANESIPEHQGYNGGTMIRKDRYGQNLQIGCRYKF